MLGNFRATPNQRAAAVLAQEQNKKAPTETRKNKNK